MKINIVAVKREAERRILRAKRKSIKPDNAKRTKTGKKYHDTFDI